MILLATGTLANGSTWHDSLTLTKPSGTTLTLSTQRQYTDKDIQLTLNAQTATPSFSGGTVSNRNIDITNSENVTISNTNTSGVALNINAGLTINDIVYNNAVNGWVNATNGSVAKTGYTTSWSNDTKYITGVTLGLGKSFDIAIPNGDGSGYIALRFMVDSLGNTTVVTANDSATIPTASASDDGKILEVINGVWTKTNIENAMGGEY